MVGTHTHVGTVDKRVLPKGTAYITDVGMTGPLDSVLGSEIGPVMERFLTGMPQRLTVANGPVIMNSVLIDVDKESKGTKYRTFGQGDKLNGWRN